MAYMAVIKEPEITVAGYIEVTSQIAVATTLNEFSMIGNNPL